MGEGPEDTPPGDDVASDRIIDGVLAELDPDDIDVDAITREERLAQRRLSSIEAGRRKGGTVGAAMAGAMLALSEIYEGPPKDVDIVATAESPSEPGDIDLDGIDVTVGDVDVWAPPPPPPSHPDDPPIS